MQRYSLFNLLRHAVGGNDDPDMFDVYVGRRYPRYLGDRLEDASVALMDGSA